MKKIYILLLAFILISCHKNSEIFQEERSGLYSGNFTYGDFSDPIIFEIEKDSDTWEVFFSSLEQNAIRIPFQEVVVTNDSIFFKLQSDFYTYSFKNKWLTDDSILSGSLSVDSIIVNFILRKDNTTSQNWPKSEEVIFQSNGLNLNGTIWDSGNNNKKGLVIVTSSGNADRSASRAEAILFAQKGFTTFHYDKRGTGTSDGDWAAATIEDLASDDINAIQFFSEKTGIPLSAIGIKGSSQGAAKIPYILNELENLNYGIAVSCPGVSLLESDLNYWKNMNEEILGDDLEAATIFQRKVYEFIAGNISQKELEKAIETEKSSNWFAHVWVPDLDKMIIDEKLNYSSIPFFEKTNQPILIIQGTMDEIIPLNSDQLIVRALAKSKNDNYKTVLLEGASHSMNLVGKSDFPYWNKLHPLYVSTVEDWIKTVSNVK